METKEAYTLCWPAGYQRTVHRKASPFKQTMDKAQKMLKAEIERLGGTELIVSTNLSVRRDGQFYSDDLKKRVDDSGVAIYFIRKKKQIALCCDQYNLVWDKIVGMTVEEAIVKYAGVRPIMLNYSKDSDYMQSVSYQLLSQLLFLPIKLLMWCFRN